MKLIEAKEKEEKFEPFELNLLVETEEEARLLWQIFNAEDIARTISNNYNMVGFGNIHGAKIKSRDIRDYIASKVEIYKDIISL